MRPPAAPPRQPTMDRDGYPTGATLKALKNWPYPDPSGALDFMAAAWYYPTFVVRELRPAEAEVVHAQPKERFIRFVTGGWSGNEDLISAFSKNMNYFFTWRLSTRSGLHIFQYLEMNKVKIAPPRRGRKGKV